VADTSDRAAAVRPIRDPEDRIVDHEDQEGKREKMLDKTIADSFPASDPPSSLPDPNEDSFEQNDLRSGVAISSLRPGPPVARPGAARSPRSAV
jgi:hypothetical protein